MSNLMQKETLLWCFLVISTSIILGFYTGPGGYIVPLVIGAMIINYLIRGRTLPIIDKSKSSTVQFLVGFSVFTSSVMLVSYALGFIFLR